MTKRDWINPPERPLSEVYLGPETIHMPTELERTRECLLSLADLAHELEPGQYMVIQRHDGKDHPDRRLFTARTYGVVEDKL